MSFYHSKTVSCPFEQAIVKVTEALKSEGFGVLTTIDLAGKLKEKINVDFRRYVILGACNPPLAYRALQAEDKIGVMLPCNVIVQQISATEVEIAAIDPSTTMKAIGNADLIPVAEEVSLKLKRVIEMS
ncbi:MAG: DUF302 domain-containing protein [Chitinispirillaceae bacterium]|nr:DUF302 domain-containing protein [Chitinispirillaceae bacterium]